MLEDRDYMRAPEFRSHRISLTIALLIVNAVVFIAQWIGLHQPDGARIQDVYFALSLEGLKQGYVWQLLTFQFMHMGWLHLLFNSVAIFFFGRPVEQIFGGARFLKIYFLSGIAGGLVQMLFAFLFPNYFGGAVVGASAGAFGLLGAFSIMNWRERFTIFVYFIFPINVSGKILFWVFAAISVFGFLFPNSHIANAAHLGGIITGAIYAKLILRQMLYETYQNEPREFAPARMVKKIWKSSSAAINEDLSADEFLQTKVDPILDKISTHGIQSLTKQERDILEKARNKMGKR